LAVESALFPGRAIVMPRVWPTASPWSAPFLFLVRLNRPCAVGRSI